ncbi:40S ribosomal protein S27-like [Vidua macroura]|uniref:40S ribosomal protein S27-like n=1 Tax=Vidua macroura TaxID=187451 RepID=UPI0023A8560C|nr:40S ribosomal protein S27-like [Vidua macroura]
MNDDLISIQCAVGALLKGIHSPKGQYHAAVCRRHACGRFAAGRSRPRHTAQAWPRRRAHGKDGPAADMPLAKDLVHPSLEDEKRKHKKKRLVQSPNSYFMDVKCPGCYKITTVFSHAQTVVLCVGCSTVLCQPTGGKARLTEGCSFRRKQH